MATISPKPPNQPINEYPKTRVGWCLKRFSDLSELKELFHKKEFVQIANKVCQAVIAVFLIIPAFILDKIWKYERVQKEELENLEIKPEIKPPLTKPISLPEKPKPIYHYDYLSIKNNDDWMLKTINFFDNDEIKTRQAPKLSLSTLGPQVSDELLIEALLQDHRGFVIGEDNMIHAPIMFLMLNLSYLASRGVKILYMNNISYYYQNVIDTYLQGQRFSFEEDEFTFNALLDDISAFLGADKSLFTAQNILETCRTLGIRLVGTYFGWGESYIPVSFRDPKVSLRTYAMYKIIEHTLDEAEPDAKFVAYMGYSNVCREEGTPAIPGMIDLLQCPGIFISDMSNVKSPERYVAYEENGIKQRDEFKLISSLAAEIFC